MICLTFDVEERFHSHLAPGDTAREWRMERCISRIIDCLLEHGRTATFFVVGELAEQYPACEITALSNSASQRRFIGPADPAQLVEERVVGSYAYAVHIPAGRSPRCTAPPYPSLVNGRRTLALAPPVERAVVSAGASPARDGT